MEKVTHQDQPTARNSERIMSLYLKRKLAFLGKPDDGFGWGVANANLVSELKKICDLQIQSSTSARFDCPVFVPIADSALNPAVKVKRAERVIGYCFTEWPLTDEARRNSRLYDHIFCGSEWNTQKLKAAGINHCSTLVQGVDVERFNVQPPCERPGFIIFSGGKYEFRKGQDYVLAAMRIFMAKHPDTALITAWHNQWPASIQSMRNTWLINPEAPLDGFDKERVIQLPKMSNAQMPGIYGMSHVGLFPNRCEAGTNMVMTEYMASGRTVIASDAHGHKDVLCDATLKLSNGSYDAAGWFNPNVSDILAHLEYAYANREDIKERGLRCAAFMRQFTWRACAEKIAAQAFKD